MADVVEELQKRCCKSPLRDDLQDSVLEQLDVAHIRARDFRACRDDIIEQLGEILRVGEPCADLLHARHGREVSAELCIEDTDRFFRAFALGDVPGDFRGADDVPRRRSSQCAVPL